MTTDQQRLTAAVRDRYRIERELGQGGMATVYLAADLNTLRPTVPANVAAAVEKALAKLPADRFPTAESFGEALVNPGFALPRGRRPPAVAPHRRVGTAAVAFGLLAAAGAGEGGGMEEGNRFRPGQHDDTLAPSTPTVCAETVADFSAFAVVNASTAFFFSVSGRTP